MKKFTPTKFSSLLVLILIAWGFNACQGSKNYVDGVKKISDIEKMNLKGPVKTLNVKTYRVSKNRRTGKITKRGLSRVNYKNLSYVFNENGNITEKTNYDAQDHSQAKWTYTYDEKKGRIIEKVYNAPDEEPRFKRVDYYNKNGNKTKHLGYAQGEDDDPYKETFTYDKNGHILEKIDYKSSGPFKTQYKYDDKGHLIEKTELMAGNPMMKETYEYDDRGNLLTSKQNEGRTVHANYVFEKKYKKGKEIERKVYKNGKSNGRFLYTYNEQGDRVEYQKYDLDNKLVAGEKMDFDYDENNNWIRKMPLDRRGIPKYLLERKIAYYNK